MSITDAFSRPVGADTTDTATAPYPTATYPAPTYPVSPTGVDLRTVKPLPAWFFVFEGLFGGAYDILRTSPDTWAVLAVLALINITISLTVLGKRRKLIRAMLKNGRTRSIAVGLIALRVGLHLALGALGAEVSTAIGHLVLALAMTGVTVALLWFDQRVTFRTLGIPLSR